MSEQKSGNSKLIVILVVIIALIAVAAVLLSSNIPSEKKESHASVVEETVSEPENEAIDANEESPSEENAAVEEAETVTTDADETSQDEAKEVTIADPDADPVVTIVNGVKVKRSEVFQFINNLPPNMRQQVPPEDLFPLAQEQILSGKVVEIKAEKANLEESEEVAKRLEEAKKQIVRAVYLEQEMEKRLTEKRVKAAYDEYIKAQGEVKETKARHILVDSEEKAKDMIKKLDAGEDFEKLAKEHSKGPSGARGGDLGYFAEADMVPEFSKAAFDTKVGEYTKTPVKTRFGWHVIKIEDRRIRPPAPYDQIKPMLEVQERRKILDELIGGWVNDAEIEVFDINGNPLPKEEKVDGKAE